MTETQTEKIPRKKRIKNADEIAIEQRCYAEIGSRIKKLREDAGLTQKAVADVLGTRTSFVALIEGGQRVPMYQVQRILETIGYTIDFTEKKTQYILTKNLNRDMTRLSVARSIQARISVAIREGYYVLPKLQVSECVIQ